MIAFAQPYLLALLVLIPLSIFIALPRFRRIRSQRADVGRLKANSQLASHNYLLNRNAIASLVVRCALITCVVLALAGIQSVQFNNKLSVAFLIDASDSVGSAGKDTAAQWVRDAMSAMRIDGNDQSAVVVFGADAQIERNLNAIKDLAPLGTAVAAGGTNIEQAIRLGISLLPNDSAKRLVLLSDGKPTSGDADAASRLARAVNARLDVVPIPSTQGPDAAVERVDAPQRASVGQSIPLQIAVRSNVVQNAKLTVFSGPDTVAEQQVSLNVGINNFTIRATATRAGFSSFRVQLVPERDITVQNNSLAASVIVGGPPRVLIVSSPPSAGTSVGSARTVDEVGALKGALTASGINFEESTPRAMPSEIQSLAGYQAVVLANVPARDLSLRTMFSLQSYVRDIGGGLITIGGPNSYGVGGYFKTPLEDTLPIESQVKDPKRFPSVSIVIVMDKSGSMGIKENGVEKMRIADEAAARVAELANEDDEITVIAFDTEPVDVIGPFAGRDRAKQIPKILSIATGGGGIYIYESLVEAQKVMRQSNKLTKFVILLADGNDSEHQPNAREVARAMRNEGVVMSVVAIGDGTDVPFLKDMARIGEGRFHLTDRAANLPTIFTEETAIAQRSYIVEDPFFAKLGATSPIMNGIDSVPQLLGYIASVPKPSAQVILKTQNDDPLLATWQYGLGRAVSFTSDVTGRWGKEWVVWKDLPKFLAQTIRWTVLDRNESQVQARVVQRNDQTSIVADIPGIKADDDYRLTATIIDSDGKTAQVPLAQTAPGRFEADAPLDQPGSYFVRVASTAGDESTVAYVKPYSPEYNPTAGGEDLLKAWAKLGGGEVLTSPAQAFDLNVPAAASRTDLSMLFLTLAALLLPLDIGVRRIAISLRKALARLLPQVARESLVMASASPASLNRLSNAKLRGSTAARSAAQPRAAATSNRANLMASSATVGKPAANDQMAKPEDSPAKEESPPILQPAQQSSATAAELLRRKKKQKRDAPAE